MNQKAQENDRETPVISPLAQDKTYGERAYSGVFDWGLNYWTNLLASAGFSQWAEHATRPIKLPFLEKASPRQLQSNLADWLAKKDPFMKRLFNDKLASDGLAVAEKIVSERSMARARSLTLLTPGFAVMIPSVWLGAKIKPWFVETLNRHHYGDEAMDDPSLQARHQAIAAEARPTLLGTLVARLGTVLAVQIAAQSVGSDNNLINKWGEKHGNKTLGKFAIDPVTEKIGSSLGGVVPQGLQERYNRFAQRKGMSWSNNQLKEAAKTGTTLGSYTTATQDLGRFIAADTVYTLITALAIRPLLSLLRHVPGMTYQPKVPANSATFDGERIRVPTNPLADIKTDNLDADELATRETPRAKVSHIESQSTLVGRPQPQIA
ncbi:MAG: hypothetical protein V4735_00885 [Pseudomonadota bacterium]